MANSKFVLLLAFIMFNSLFLAACNDKPYLRRGFYHKVATDSETTSPPTITPPPTPTTTRVPADTDDAESRPTTPYSWLTSTTPSSSAESLPPVDPVPSSDPAVAESSEPVATTTTVTTPFTFPTPTTTQFPEPPTPTTPSSNNSNSESVSVTNGTTSQPDPTTPTTTSQESAIPEPDDTPHFVNGTGVTPSGDDNIDSE